MTNRTPESANPWREVLGESFDHVQAIGGLFALDVEYYLDRKTRKRCYRLLWTNRLATENGAAHSQRKPWDYLL